MAEVTSTTALPGLGAGRLYATSYNGTTNLFACSSNQPSSSAAYIRQTQDFGVNWSDIEGPSGAPGIWADFCQFDEFLICGSRARVPQQKSLFAAVGTTLADLAGSPPTGATIARVRDHVVIGNLTTDNLSKFAIRWGAFGDPEDWPTPGTADARSKQAGIQYMPVELGEVLKIVGGEKSGLVFQERGITRMTYVGGSAVFEFDTFEKKIGAGARQLDANSVLIPHPVTQVDNLFVWANVLYNRGIFATDGYSIRKISEGVLDQRTDIWGNNSYSAAYDDRKRILCIPMGGPDLLYNIETQTFTGGNDDNLTFSVVDSPINDDENDKPIISVKDSGMKLAKMDSTTQQTIAAQTGYIEIEKGYRVQIQGAEILGVGTPGDLEISAKAAGDFEAVDTSESGFTSLTENPHKVHMGRLDGRFVAFRITGVPTSGQLLQGLRIYYERSTQI